MRDRVFEWAGGGRSEAVDRWRKDFKRGEDDLKILVENVGGRGWQYAYGRYLAVSCIGCPHVTGTTLGWTEENFIATLRTQQRPNGTAVNPIMPAAFERMTDLEIKALGSYLLTLEPYATRRAA